jgi:hypothetical protein
MSKDDKTDIVKAPSTNMVESHTGLDMEIINQLDNNIKGAFKEIISDISEDRGRAKEVFEELFELVLNGDTHPDALRELNKAQENIQSTTSAMNKFLDTLAKIRQGTDKIQIAQINNTKQNDDSTLNKGDLVKLLTEMMDEEEKQENDE